MSPRLLTPSFRFTLPARSAVAPVRAGAGASEGAVRRLIPLFTIWFGIGETPKIAIIGLGVAFPLHLDVYAGIRGVDSQLS